jgi:hypothetical protein
MMMRLPALLVLAVLAACAAGAAPPRDPELCGRLFWRYDTVARVYGTSWFDERGAVVPSGPLSRPSHALRNNGCLTYARDLDGLPALAERLAPYRIENSGAAIRPVPVHLGIVTSIYDEGRVTQFFRGLGYRSRGVGAETLGRRIYIGPFTTQGAVDQALQTAREAGFIAPYVATYTKF